MARKRETNKQEVKGFSSFLNNSVDFTLLITILIFETIAISLFVATKNLFYLLNFHFHLEH